MALTHTTLIELIEKLDYPIYRGGMCYGFAVMGMQAMLANDYKTFYQRLHFMDEYLKTHTVDQFAQVLKKIETDRIQYLQSYKEEFFKEIGEDIQHNEHEFYKLLEQYKDTEAALNYNKKLQAINQNIDNHFLDIRAFLELLTLYFFPYNFPDLFDPKTKPFAQQADRTFVRGLPPSLVNIETSFAEDKETGREVLVSYAEESVIKKMGVFAGLYRLDELIELSQILWNKNSLLSFDSPLGFLLSSGTHAVSVSYHKETQRWHLFDAEKLISKEFDTPFELATEIFNGFSENEVCTFTMEVYSHKAEENKVKMWLDNITSSETWQEINDIDGKENLADSENNTLLLNAATIGDMALARALLENSLSTLDYPNINGLTPIYAAALNGHADMVELLILHGANSEVRTNAQGTPLHIAASGGHFDIVDILLEQKVAIDPKTSTGYTPLHIAMTKGNVAMVKKLLENGANPDEIFNNQYPLQYAIEIASLEMVQLLLKADAELDPILENGYTPLLLAAEYGETEIVKALLLKGADPTTQSPSWSLLQWAVFNGEEEIIDLLLSQNVPIDHQLYQGYAPIHIAAEKGDLATLEKLLAKGANVLTQTDNGDSPLSLAIKNGHFEIVKKLYDYVPLNPNVKKVKFHMTESQDRFFTADKTTTKEKTEENKDTALNDTHFSKRKKTSG